MFGIKKLFFGNGLDDSLPEDVRAAVAAWQDSQAGALEEATQSGVASLSRLDNAIKRLQRAFAESGFMREVTAAFNDMTAALNNAEGKARTLGAPAIGCDRMIDSSQCY